MQGALLHTLQYFLSELLPVTMVAMTSKCKFDRQNDVLKNYLPRHSFCSQYGFSNSVNDKSHEDTKTRPTISMSSSRYFSRMDLSVSKC